MNERTMKLSFVIMLLILPLPVLMRRGIVKTAVCATVCTVACRTACNVNLVCHLVCAPSCAVVCDKVGRKKRSLRITAGNIKQFSEDPRLHGTFACSLSVYDTNKDGRISMAEFTRAATGNTRADPGAKEAFTLSDKNDDKYLDCQEFKISPLKFDKEPTCI